MGVGELGIAAGAGMAAGLIGGVANAKLTSAMRREDPGSTAPILPTSTLGVWGLGLVAIGAIARHEGAMGSWPVALVGAGAGLATGAIVGLIAGLGDAKSGSREIAPGPTRHHGPFGPFGPDDGRFYAATV